MDSKKTANIKHVAELLSKAQKAGIAVECLSKVLVDDESNRLNEEQRLMDNCTRGGLYYALELIGTELSALPDSQEIEELLQ